MADSVRLEFKGMKEIEAMFEKMSQVDRVKFFTKIFNPIGTKIVAEMKAESPMSRYGSTSKKYPSRNHPAGAFRQSIGKKLGGTDIPTMWISPNRRGKFDVFYQHMVTGGHELGSSTIPPNPVVRRTYDRMKSWIESQCEQRAKDQLKAMIG
jgi:hypothetical protein